MNNQQSRTSSPNATGGGGTHFEQHVDAVFLALLLVRGIPPIFTDCTVEAVHLQAERLGWKTDDLIVECETGSGGRRQLVAQVKQSVTVSSSNDEFKKTIVDAWLDFNNEELFDRENDRIAIITLRGTNVFLGDFAGLLDCARSSRTVEEFTNRLGTEGFVSKKVIHYFDEIKKIIEETEGSSVDESQVWEFLCFLNVLSYDLNTSTRQTEALVKSLLAHTAGGAGAVGVSDTTWNKLLSEVGEGKPRAKTYCYEDLPQELRDKHSPVETSYQQALQRLKEHSGLILDGINTTIGDGIKLPREKLIQNVLDDLQQKQIILVSGNAGSGKSVVAKKVIEQASANHFTFAFRAEEFTVAHLDETLHKAQADITGVTLGVVLSGQSQKLLLIESVERLLEAPTRDAFADLIQLLRTDPSWGVILTCRDYSSDLVRSALLPRSGVAHITVPIPPLDDDELNKVSEEYPDISQPLSNTQLRNLLRNPYMLDKATQMRWLEERPLPENERTFRTKFWAEIVRVNDNAADNMPRRREETFIDIALRRAQALTMYASRSDMDSEAVNKLIGDSLVVASEQSDSLIAPAHDVLEDWAIMYWINQQFLACQGDYSKLPELIGSYPAIRRSYRKWLGELVEYDANSADSLFVYAISTNSLPAQFRDDTLVSLLQSADPTEFLQRHVELLFKDNQRLLRRIIHLLRVGCMTTPDWFEGGAELEFEIYEPEGKAWPCILEMVRLRLADFGDKDTGLLLGLIEDGSSGVSWKTPYPDGSEEIVEIAHWLLPFFFNDYRHEEQGERALKVIAKLPKCNEEKFRLLMIGDPESGNRNRVTEDLREIVLSGMEGYAACRDIPNVVIDVTRECMFLTEEKLKEKRGFGFSIESDSTFGIQRFMHGKDFPASAFRGPFYSLLRDHLAKGVVFINELFNHSAEWYGSGRVPTDYIEQSYKIVLTFSDESKFEQWCNGQLWNLYRGTSVGPYSLQSALMALEKCLLEMAEFYSKDLDKVLISILQGSRSVAVTAVVASIATAYPHDCVETLLVFLRSPECIHLDRNRMVSDLHMSSDMSAILPSLSQDKTYDNERKESNRLPHRSRQLENAILNLQLGPSAERVQKILDWHLESIPPEDQRSEGDRVWMLAIRRMDLRKYEVSDHVEKEEETKQESSEEERRKLLRFDLKVDDPDLLAMSNEATTQQDVMDNRLGLQMWGMQVFENKTQTRYDPNEWKIHLKQARLIRETRDDERLGRSGPEFVAAVCVRDHFDDLSNEEACWCVETICEAIEENADKWHRMDRVQRGLMEGDRPCAWIISALINKSLPSELEDRVRRALILAITHSNDEVCTYANDGVGRQLWTIDADLAMRCVNMLAFEASTVQLRLNAEQERPFNERKELVEIEYEVAQQVRSKFDEKIPGSLYENLNVSDWIGSLANCRIISILRHSPENSVTVRAFKCLADVLVIWWDQDEELRGSSERRQHSDGVEISLESTLEDFVLRIDIQAAALILAPVLTAIDRHPRKVANIIQGIISAEDQSPSTRQFWQVWQLFADRIKTASWLKNVDRKHSSGSEVFSAIFLTQYWKKETKHWKSLGKNGTDSHAYRVHELFDVLPPTSVLLDNYVRFLYEIGERCLPNAFQHVASKLKTGDAQSMLRMSNTVFMLETLLRRYVYGRPLELKKNMPLRDSVLYLLDTLVEAGSSSAYRMRDDFVTPMSSTAE